MDVKLYYIEGISRSDTPYFFTNNGQATLARQASYFASKLVKTISTSFYPPHYENEIKFDTDDADFDDTVNYLSLNYNNKEYYYFIDAIEYVNETIIKLYVTMDVIQTYMFNIRIASGVIQRKFINRWNSEAINRNYLRENVSRGNKLQTNYVTLEHAYENGVLIMKRTAQTGEYHSLYRLVNSTAFPNSTINSTPTDLYVALFPGGVLHYGSTNEQDVNAYNLLEKKASDAYVWDCYIIPFNPFNNLHVTQNYYTSDNDIWVPETDSGGNKFGSIKQGTYGQTSKTVSYELKDNVRNYTFGFEKNIYTHVTFHTYLEPCLLDENYIEFYFGSRGTPTSYPLHKLIGNRVHMHYYADIFSGNRYYAITDENDIDTYRTCVIDTNVIGPELLNENWKQYIAANKSRWASAAITSGLSLIAAIATYGGTEYGAIGKDITKVSETQFKHLARNKKGQFTKKLTRVGSITKTQARTIYGDIPNGSTFSDFLGDMSGILMPLVAQGARDINAKFTPDTVKGTGNIGDILGYSCDVVCWQETVDDLDACAQFYHRNGNLVNEYVNNIDDIFDYVKNRYYYNIVKMELPEVHLVDVIEDQDTVSEIKDRLESGVRLWRVIAEGNQYSEYDDPIGRTVGETYTITLPFRINTLFGGTATLVPGTGTGSCDLIIVSSTENTITYRLSGGASTGALFAVNFTGVFYSYSDVVNIGNYTYDNVEIDYLS